MLSSLVASVFSAENITQLRSEAIIGYNSVESMELTLIENTDVRTLGEVKGVLGQGPMLIEPIQSFSPEFSGSIGFAALNLDTETDP